MYAKTFQQKRGLEKNLPMLKPGELAFTTDTKSVFVGSDEGNIEVPNKGVTDTLNTLLLNITKKALVMPEFFGASPTANAATNRSAIQQALDFGGHVYLGTPGTYLINSTLLIGSNTTIELGIGVTIKLANGSNCNMMRNKDAVNRNKNITITGGTWDYNYLNQVASNLDTMSIFLHKVDVLKIKDVTMLNTTKYTFLVADASDVSVDGITFNTHSDGLHFQPPLKGADIRNLKGTTGDDMLAFTIGDFATYEVSRGDFENISINGLYPVNALTAVKFAGNVEGRFKSINIENIFGTVQNHVIFFQNDLNLLETNIDDVFIKNVKATSNKGWSIFYAMVNTIKNIRMENITHVNGTDPAIRITNNTVIKNFSLKQFTSDWGAAIDLIRVDPNAKVENFTIDVANCAFADSANACSLLQVKGTVTLLNLINSKISYPADRGKVIDHLSNGTITEIRINNTEMLKGKNFFTQGATIPTPVYIFANGLNIENIGTAFDLYGIGEIRISQCRFKNLGGFPVNVRGSANVIVLGSGDFTERNFVNKETGGTCSVSGNGIRADAGQLTKRPGDTVYNTNASLSCGVGQVLTDGNTWKNLFTGATTSN